MRSIMNISLFTLRKHFKNKAFWGIIFLNAVMLLLLNLMNVFDIKTPPLIFVDSFLFIYEAFALFLILIIGVNSIRADIVNKGIYLILSRPVSKVEYIIGKITGNFLLILIFTFIALIECSIFSYLFYPDYMLLLLISVIYRCLFLLIMLTLTVVLSIFFRPVINIIIVILVYYLSTMNYDYIQMILTEIYPNYIINTLMFLKFIVPNSDYLNLNLAVMQLASIPFYYYMISILYLAGYMGFAISLTAWIFRKRDI